jgi:hypothetical protein
LQEATNPTFFAVMLKDCCLLIECRLEMVTMYARSARRLAEHANMQLTRMATARAQLRDVGEFDRATTAISELIVADREARRSRAKS